MIPNFKTYLKESVWGDLRKKSLGQDEREENNINYMDGEEFCEYLNSIYVSEKPHWKRLQSTVFMDDIMLMQFFNNGVYHNLYIEYVNGRKEIKLISVCDRCVSWYPELEDVFEVTFDKEDDKRLDLYPKDGSKITNKFAIKVIDYLLDNSENKDENLFIKKVHESVWGDLRKKSLGQEARIEVDVNTMDKNQFFDYLVSHYVYTGQKPERYSIHKDTRGDNNMVILIPIYRYKDYAESYYLRIDYNIKGKTISPESSDKLDTDNSIMIRYDDWIKPEPGIFDKLDDRFGIDDINEYDPLEGKSYTTYWNIHPPKGTGTYNQFFVDVIDYIIDNLEEPLYPTIKRKGSVSESVWNDIRKKSLGQEARTESDINNMTFEQFVRFIQDRYDVLEQPAYFHIGSWVDSTNTSVLSVPLERNRHEETPNHGNRILKIEMDMSTNEYMCIMPNRNVSERIAGYVR